MLPYLIIVLNIGRYLYFFVEHPNLINPYRNDQ